MQIRPSFIAPSTHQTRQKSLAPSIVRSDARLGELSVALGSKKMIGQVTGFTDNKVCSLVTFVQFCGCTRLLDEAIHAMRLADALNIEAG